jgi:hypothetical protein
VGVLAERSHRGFHVGVRREGQAVDVKEPGPAHRLLLPPAQLRRAVFGRPEDGAHLAHAETLEQAVDGGRVERAGETHPVVEADQDLPRHPLRQLGFRIQTHRECSRGREDQQDQKERRFPPHRGR